MASSVTPLPPDRYSPVQVRSFNDWKVVGDTDDDTLLDSWELLKFGNLAQGSTDDPDSDGLTNLGEFLAATDPNDADTDDDALPDGWEVTYSLNPLVDDSAGDADSDGLTNAAEYSAGSNPGSADTDSDGLPDKWELDNGTSVASNDAGADPDGDGYTNIQEYSANTNPQDPDSTPDSADSPGHRPGYPDVVDELRPGQGRQPYSRNSFETVPASVNRAIARSGLRDFPLCLAPVWSISLLNAVNLVHTVPGRHFIRRATGDPGPEPVQRALSPVFQGSVGSVSCCVLVGDGAGRGRAAVRRFFGRYPGRLQVGRGHLEPGAHGIRDNARHGLGERHHLRPFHPGNLHPNNPGTLLLGTAIYSDMLFSREEGVVCEARLRVVDADTGGQVAAFFLYEAYDGASDEIDYEFLTNQNTDQVLLTSWDNWVSGLSHNDGEHHADANPVVGGIDYSGWTTVRMYWEQGRVRWEINGETVHQETGVVPDQAMKLHLSLWAPESGWSAAYDASLAPVSSSGSNTAYSMDVDYVKVSRLDPAETVPALGTDAFLLLALALVLMGQYAVRGRFRPRF